VLDELGHHDVLQLLVEGGRPRRRLPRCRTRQSRRLVPSRGVRGGEGTLAALRDSRPYDGSLTRGRIVDVRRIGEDIRIDVEV